MTASLGAVRRLHGQAPPLLLLLSLLLRHVIARACQHVEGDAQATTGLSLLQASYVVHSPLNISADVASVKKQSWNKYKMLFQAESYEWTLTTIIFVLLFLLSATICWQLSRIPQTASRSSTEADDTSHGAAAGAALATLAANDEDPSQPRLLGAVSVGNAAMLYITLSWALIKYNNWLMQQGRFPFAANLTFGHQLIGASILFVFYLLRPRAFPCLEGSSTSVVLTWELLLWRVVPVAFFFSGQLVLSNVAYKYVSVAFIQMMKEGNMVLVFIMCLSVGLERFNVLRAEVLLCLLLSTCLTIKGELAFDLYGVFVQGSGQVMESIKIVLQAILLSPAGGLRMDALSYNILVQSCSSVLLAFFLFGSYTLWDYVVVASWADYAMWWPHLLVNACLALALNVSIACFLSKSSAIGFIAVGIMKDVLIVLGDAFLARSQVSRVQWVAFSLQCVFLFLYSTMKTFPARFGDVADAVPTRKP
eukprot:TRINITY_DN71921_c0_g1_i1.p1 TRINITY_DN71921_c0_g1~~TRINITY_DN71921_c0_g1_i1.p1  ORF type:complete len:478 (+),score=72.92 TRINITY_DN71921_c0_g1_i1:48-1481(+)